ncbi:hypothetical protein C8Q75DRAFT_739598 [Abortiporus biennis]|nr:hypothetical protein C8Q75DRAFT_739598 [Abortiporus biennis]
MRCSKIYVHPSFSDEDSDMSLFATFCLVFFLLLIGAGCIMAVSCLLIWKDCKSVGFSPYDSTLPFWKAGKGILW